MTLKEKIGIIGVGKMGGALATCLVSSGLVDPAALRVCDKDETKLAYLAGKGIITAQGGGQVAKACDVIILAIKPAEAGVALREIQDALAGKLLISIVAGLPTRWISNIVPEARVVRVMPNTPLLLQEGATAYSLGNAATEDDGRLVENIFSAAGVVYMVDERLLDAVTGLSGSGPAYFYLAIDAMAKEGAQQGIPLDIALKLAAQTAVGAGKMVLQTGKSPEELTAMVASPGGTTVEGLLVLSDRQVQQAFAEAVKAATERSKKLGAQQQK
jgi:pyrroline-5-carboxylate reductase